MQDANAAASTPSAVEIARALVDVVEESDAGEVDRITLERATPHEYMVRIYPVAGEEYEAHAIRFAQEGQADSPSDAVSAASWGGE